MQFVVVVVIVAVGVDDAVEGGGFLGLGEGEVGGQARGVEDEEDAVDVGVLDAGGADDFHLFGEGVFEFAFDKGGDFAQLEVGYVLLEALGVPERQADAFAVDFGFEVLGFEVGV